MKLADILARENLNTEYIELYPERGFYIAVGLSAFLLQTFIWPEITVLYKKPAKQSEFLRVGFPFTSLEPRVLAVADEKKIPCWQCQEEDLPPLPIKTPSTPLPKLKPVTVSKKAPLDRKKLLREQATPPEKQPVIFLGPFEVDQEAYQKGRDSFLTDYKRAQSMMEPFYGKLPVYKKNYDLMRLVLHTLKDYPRELRDSLGARLFALLVDINRQFYQIALLPDDNKDKITLIDQMKAQFDEALFLVRVSHDLQACGSKRAIQLTEHIISITNQLNAWRESFIKEIVEAAPTQSS